mmetsp:Transcript_4352/g.5712  ORF Transcript_4352/g.5712 Transcript_4352/m.5712 type:complete len:111 (-) Transcript_4352:95-427(-)
MGKQSKSKSKEEPTKQERKPAWQTKKPLPSVGELLAHGDPEASDKPQTWADIFFFPTFLAIAFSLSFILFINSPLAAKKENPHKLPRTPPKEYVDLSGKDETATLQNGEL